MMKRLFLACCCIASFTCLFSQSPVVQTEAGPVSGIVSSNHIYTFKGIPFAAPPVGDLRWKAPQPVAHWKGVKACTAFAASPVQNVPVPFMMYTAPYLIPPSPIGEDCLYLNVWTAATGGKKPVMVWIYGGGFVSGGTACPIYDGENIAKKGVVFVSIPYRVGVFGFLAHPELSKEAGGKASGNYAFLDQLAALRWVQKNIAAFGGDPDNVTIIGQSAGAFSVNALVASPLAKGLFQKAIAQSGGLFSADGRGISLTAAESNGEAFMEKTGAASVADLRKMPADSLLKHSADFTASPVIDGYVLPKNVYSVFEKGEQNAVPVLTGWNAQDGFPGPAADSVAYMSGAKETYGDLAIAYLEAFPGATAAQRQQSAFALSRDNLFAWQGYTWAKLQTAKSGQPVYLYYFNQPAPGEERWGAFHSSEIPFALDNLDTWKKEWPADDRKLADMISQYWVNFAATGNPNGNGLPQWKAFRDAQNAVMVLRADGVVMKPVEVLKELRFLDVYQEELRKKGK